MCTKSCVVGDPLGQGMLYVVPMSVAPACVKHCWAVVQFCTYVSTSAPAPCGMSIITCTPCGLPLLLLFELLFCPAVAVQPSLNFAGSVTFAVYVWPLNVVGSSVQFGW